MNLFKTKRFSDRNRPLWLLAILLLGLPGVMFLLSFAAPLASISGVVFRDFNANGTIENTSSYHETGVAGVTVTAYDATGANVGSATTDALGAYSLAGLTNLAKYRIEFTGLQTGDFSAGYGSASGTSVQFATAGATDINLGVNYPAQYAVNRNPNVITSMFVGGNNSGSSPILVSLPFLSSGDFTGTVSGKTSRAIASQVGSVWGQAYAKKSKKVYSAAFTKRHVGFGTLGPGGIYVTDLTDNSVASFVTVPSAGTIDRTGENVLPASTSEKSWDDHAFDGVGKTGLGDIDISDDEKYLYTVNLFDRKLYKIEIATKTITSVAIPDPGCTVRPASGSAVAGEYRPFALNFHRGKVYVGIVCSNETNEGGTRPYASHNGVDRNTEGMNASVWEYDGSTFTKVLDTPLTYRKEPSNNENYSSGYPDAERSWYWNPWTATFRVDRNQAPASGGRISYPQPWLTDIEFDVNGDMILGIRDRFGDQMGWDNVRPKSSYTGTVPANDLYKAIAPGEILRARKCPAATVWTTELNGGLCGSDGSASQTSTNIHGPGWGHTIGTSPAVRKGGKYYWGEQVGEGVYHGSSSAGGLSVLAGSDELIMTAIDPFDVLNTSGIRRVTNSTGASPTNNGAYLIGSSGSLSWGKANGMGDIELLTEPAPIEIGNRVWSDADGDGVQDAGELGIAGVTVELLGSDGTTVISTAVTDAEGRYIFSSGPGSSVASFKYGLTDLIADGTFTVRIPNISGVSKQAALAGLSLTGKDKDATTNGDQRDSDGTITGVNAIAAVTTGGGGENNHSFDFGFLAAVNLGNKVWLDANNDGLLNNGETPISGATVKLYTPGDLTTAILTVFTDANGLYLFDNLTPGSYVVGVTPPAGGYVSSTVNATDPNSDIDNDDNGVTTTAGQTFSNTVTLSIAGEPIGESPDNNPGGTILDNSSNLTVDFGFYLPVNLGNKVWIDANNSGVFDAGELPVIGTTVKLYLDANDDGTPDGAAIATTVTTNEGLYLFDNLAPGNYIVGVMDPAGLVSSTKNAGDPDTDTDDGDDNGIRTVAGETFSNTVTLSSAAEPLLENPDNNLSGLILDNSSNLTVDFGFFDPTVLPVKLINFDAKSNGEGVVKLNWKTSEEVNSDFFEVQRSGNGKVWKVLGNVSSQKQSTIGHNYSFDDFAPLNGESLYRLRMVDLDQTFGYSVIRSVQMEILNTMKLFPNPTTDKIVIEAANGAVIQNVKVYSMLGKLVHEVSKPKQGLINVQHLSAGNYVLRITTADGTVETRKVIIGR